MDKLVIDDYYPKLPPDASLEQRMLRRMLQLLEEIEFIERMERRRIKLALKWGENPEPSRVEKYAATFEELRRNIRQRTGTL